MLPTKTDRLVSLCELVRESGYENEHQHPMIPPTNERVTSTSYADRVAATKLKVSPFPRHPHAPPTGPVYGSFVPPNKTKRNNKQINTATTSL